MSESAKENETDAGESPARVVTTAEGYAVCFSRELNHPVERVWAALTDRAARRLWLFDGAIELHTGGRVDLRDEYHHITGEVLEIEEPRLLVLTWHNEDDPLSRVRFEIVAGDEPGSCRLMVEHRLPTRSDPAGLAAGWHCSLSKMKCWLSDDPVGAPDFDDVMRFYASRVQTG